MYIIHIYIYICIYIYIYVVYIYIYIHLMTGRVGFWRPARAGGPGGATRPSSYVRLNYVVSYHSMLCYTVLQYVMS